VVKQVEESLAKLRERSYVKILEASVAQDRAAPIEQIQTPTLVIAGAEDRVLPPAMAYEVTRRIPKAELTMMDGVGHFPNLEQPDQFNSIVLPFLLKQAGKS
jgi:pimeloyl-ACP methyl ester carboxylesterase